MCFPSFHHFQVIVGYLMDKFADRGPSLMAATPEVSEIGVVQCFLTKCCLCVFVLGCAPLVFRTVACFSTDCMDVTQAVNVLCTARCSRVM